MPGAGAGGIAPPSRIDERFHIESAVASEFARVALVVVRVSGEKGVLVNSLRFADGIDLAQHQGISKVIAAPASRLRCGRITERRVMNGNQDCPRVVLRLDVP